MSLIFSRPSDVNVYFCHFFFSFFFVLQCSSRSFFIYSEGCPWVAWASSPDVLDPACAWALPPSWITCGPCSSRWMMAPFAKLQTDNYPSLYGLLHILCGPLALANHPVQCASALCMAQEDTITHH
jgi:hypothetical protein